MHRKFHLLAIAAIIVGGAFYLFRPGPADVSQAPMPEGAPLVEVRAVDLTGDAALGERVFDAYCAACHGENAAGRNGMAPPLVHKIYEPSHHGDAAFHLAVQNGVPSHHWNFGNMPPVEGITRAEVGYVIAYVRALQRANGID